VTVVLLILVHWTAKVYGFFEFIINILKLEIMGSFKARLTILDREVDLMFAQYQFERKVDQKSRVTSRTKIGTGGLTVRFEVTENSAYLEQMLNKEHSPFEGKIVFLNTHDESEMRTISFNNSYITKFQETFDFSNEQPHTALMSIHAEEMTVGNAAIFNEWPTA